MIIIAMISSTECHRHYEILRNLSTKNASAANGEIDTFNEVASITLSETQLLLFCRKNQARFSSKYESISIAASLIVSPSVLDQISNTG